MYLVSLYFDDKASRKIQGFINKAAIKSGKVTRIALSKTNPYEDIIVWDLGNKK